MYSIRAISNYLPNIERKYSTGLITPEKMDFVNPHA